jgi:hypothetical protein
VSWPAEVDLNGSAILQVGTDGSTGLVNSLQFNNSTITLEQADKPQVETINGQTVVGSVAKSLSKVTFSDGKIDQFHFTVDQKIQPRLVVGGSGSNSRTFGWNSTNSLITQDNDWNYQITPSADGQTAAFSRKNAAGNSESWLNDPTTGQEVTEINGVKRTTSRFASGKLSGYVRKITETTGGKETTVYRPFDDKASLANRKNSANCFYPIFNRLLGSVNYTCVSHITLLALSEIANSRLRLRC